MAKKTKKPVKAAKSKVKPSKSAAKPGKTAKKPDPKALKSAAKGKAPAAGKNAKGGKPAKGPAPKNGKAPLAAAGAKKPARVRVRICKAEGCQNPQTTQGFCRLHYLSKWKEIREEKQKRAQKNLDRYVERMAGAKKPATEEGEEGTEGGEKTEAVFEEDFGEFVDVLSREENLDKILNGIKVEDY